MTQCVRQLCSCITALGASHAPSSAGISVPGKPLEATVRLADTSVRAAADGQRGKVCERLCVLLGQRRTHLALGSASGRFDFLREGKNVRASGLLRSSTCLLYTSQKQKQPSFLCSLFLAKKMWLSASVWPLTQPCRICHLARNLRKPLFFLVFVR